MVFRAPPSSNRSVILCFQSSSKCVFSAGCSQASRKLSWNLEKEDGRIGLPTAWPGCASSLIIKNIESKYLALELPRYACCILFLSEV